MSVLCVPELEPPGKEWPTLGPQVVEFLTGLPRTAPATRIGPTPSSGRAR
jgi:hypothetical protein